MSKTMLDGFDTNAATFTQDIDFAMEIHVWLSLALFLSVVGPMFYFIWKYRADKVKNEDIGTTTHHTLLEVLWTAIPVAAVMVMFYYGNETMLKLRNVASVEGQPDTLVVKVEGSKWKWKYEYPNGKTIGGVYTKPGVNEETGEYEEGTMGISAMYVPVNTNVLLEMTAPLNDVIHSYYIPAFRTKEDVVPGRTTKMWFNATKVGEYDVECAEYCGTDHSYMYSKVVVLSQEDYDAWYNGEMDTPKGNFPKTGEAIYAQNGCASCHSIDNDDILVGPSLKGIGAKFDAQYLSDAITNPDKDVPEGFYPGIMPAFNLPAEDLANLVKYMLDAK